MRETGSVSAGLRRVGAGVAVLVWLLGLYGLPLAHNVHHRADHVHGPMGHHLASGPSRPHSHTHSDSGSEAHSHPHPHPDGAAHHGGPGERAPSEGSSPKSPPVPIDSEHGSGSILHFAAAALPGEAVAVEAAGSLVPVGPPPSPRGAPVPAARPVLARGPPSLD